jgi:hypothetical protein
MGRQIIPRGTQYQNLKEKLNEEIIKTIEKRIARKSKIRKNSHRKIFIRQQTNNSLINKDELISHLLY